MRSFDAVEILSDFSKAIRHSLISLECLHDLDGVDKSKVTALAESVRRVHSDATRYVVSVIGSATGP